MEIAGGLEQFELMVGQVFQEGVPQAVHHFGGTWAVILTAAVVKIGKETNDDEVAFGCVQLLAVSLHSLPVRDAVQLSKRPAANCPLLHLFDVDHDMAPSLSTAKILFFDFFLKH